MSTVNIEGLDKAELLSALWAASYTQGMSAFHGDATSVTIPIDSVRADIACRGTNLFFDFYRGRVIKCDLQGPDMYVYLYDRDVGTGAAARVVARLRGATKA